MRLLRALVIYLFVVFLGGALLAPWLYWLAQSAAPHFPHLKLAGIPFHRFMDRAFLGLGLAGLPPWLRAFGMGSWREIGLAGPGSRGKQLCAGLALGFLTLAVVAGSALAGGDRVIAAGLTAHKIAATIPLAAGTAMVVALLEEILFRGGIFGGLRRTLYWPSALLASSLGYAFVHFLQRAEITGPVAWNSGLVLLPHLLCGFMDFHALVPGFFSLTLAGILLGLAYQRTGNLYFSIGVHAGWIFCLKTYGAFTAGAPGAAPAFWGTGRLIDGWPALLVLAVTVGLFHFLALKPAREPFAYSQ